MKYLFKYEPTKQILAFIDVEGHLSGQVMKNIEYRRPTIIERLKKDILKNGNFIGNVIVIDHFTFFTVRKRYNNKFKLEEFDKIALNLPRGKVYKTTLENLTEYSKHLFSKGFAIEFYKSSER